MKKFFITIGILLIVIVLFLFINNFLIPKMVAHLSVKEINEVVEKEDETEVDLVGNILASMSTKEKVTQMIMPSIRNYNSSNVTTLNDDLKKMFVDNSFAGVILFSENIESKEQTVDLINSIQEANKNASTRMFIAIDQEGGSIARMNFTTRMVGNMALGATDNSKYSKDASKVIGSELKSLGFNLNFAPVVDVNSNPSNPVIGTRSFSDDPLVVSSFGKEYIRGMHDNGIMTSIKHFMGHGDTSIDSHTGLPTINKSFEELKNFELVPFIDNFSNTDMIMSAHIQYPLVDSEKYVSSKTGEELILPATLSHKIITDVLRNELKYDGVVITDSMVMDAIDKYFNSLESAKLAINAGVDIILMPIEITNIDSINNLDNYINEIVKMVDNNEISIDRINESVTRILKLKYKYDLLKEYDESDIKVDEIGSKENHDKEWDVALNSITLLKNDNDLLPLNDEKVLIMYSDSNQVDSINYALRKLNKNVNIMNYSDAGAVNIEQIMDEYDVVVIISNMYNVNQLNPNLSEGVYSRFIDNVIGGMHSKSKKVVILSTELPYEVSRYVDVDVSMLCYNSEIGEMFDDSVGSNIKYNPNIAASIYTIFGGNKPVGKLPVNIPKLDSNFNFTNDILYKRKAGLKYNR